MTSTPEDPRASLGRRLVAVHDELRATLRGLRDSSHPGRDGSLGAHCLTFCAAVSRHHRGEDAELFPQVVAADPALAAAVDQLQHDHNLIGFLLRDLTAAVQALPAEPDDQELYAEDPAAGVLQPAQRGQRIGDGFSSGNGA